MVTLTIDRARRLALAGQGLDAARPDGRVDVRHLRRTLAANHVVQLDSVSVAARAHEMPFWSRLGPHATARRDDWLWHSGECVEVDAHEQCVVPASVWPLLADRRGASHRWKGVARLRSERPGYVEDVLAQVAADGPLATAELRDPGERSPGMWGWSPGRVALAALHAEGLVAITRDPAFRIAYDLVERVLPAEVLAAEQPPAEEAHRRLLLLAARAHGVGTAADLADHWRMTATRCRPLLEQLVAAGRLERAEVRGWSEPVYRHPEVPMPREVVGGRLLSPFDPLVWFRPRLERLWGFDYRIEIYVPAAERRWGYYVLPFLLDGELVARVDCRADRAAGTLQVRAAWVEDGVDAVRVARALAEELVGLGAWLDVPDVQVAPRGDLAGTLGAALT